MWEVLDLLSPSFLTGEASLGERLLCGDLDALFPQGDLFSKTFAFLCSEYLEGPPLGFGEALYLLLESNFFSGFLTCGEGDLDILVTFPFTGDLDLDTDPLDRFLEERDFSTGDNEREEDRPLEARVLRLGLGEAVLFRADIWRLGDDDGDFALFLGVREGDLFLV